MTVRPILFSGPMVRALLDGRKTQTRRIPARLTGFGKITEFGPSDTRGYDWHFRDREMRWHDLRNDQLAAVLPYGHGDLLWVKEAWRASPDYDAYPPREMSHWPVHYEADGDPDPEPEAHMCGRRRASIHMPRWASRLTLRVTEVRVERLQEISERHAKLEGCDPQDKPDWLDEEPRGIGPQRRYGFATLWDSLNAERDGGAFSWASNPWVVAVSFEVIRANVAQVMEASDG